MKAAHRGSRALFGAVRSPAGLCLRCATTTTYTPTLYRPYSAVSATTNSTIPPLTTTNTTPPAAGATVTTTIAPESINPGPFPPLEARPSAAYDVRSGIILTRAPVVTRPLTSFESAFFFYQKRLEERLNSPFITDVFFKPDTARKLDWDIKIAEREGSPAKELGTYKGKNSMAWDDELLVGDDMSSPEHLMASLLKDAEARVSDDAEVIPAADVVPVERPVGRVTDADRKGDTRRLDRALDRTLYLVVKGKHGWEFPHVQLADENLHVGAKRAMEQSAGVNMNTWIVGRVPVAHITKMPVFQTDGQVEQRGTKTFFLKGRIMAGQADLEGNPLGYADFQWLTREELRETLRKGLYGAVRNMMTDR